MISTRLHLHQGTRLYDDASSSLDLPSMRMIAHPPVRICARTAPKFPEPENEKEKEHLR
jgi:hypothetical protein